MGDIRVLEKSHLQGLVLGVLGFRLRVGVYSLPFSVPSGSP